MRCGLLEGQLVEGAERLAGTGRWWKPLEQPDLTDGRRPRRAPTLDWLAARCRRLRRTDGMCYVCMNECD